MTYDVDFFGLQRQLPLCTISQGLRIAAFNMLGDIELTNVLAEKAYELVKDLDFDIIITAETKGIALTQALASIMLDKRGQKSFVVARKGQKLYMTNPVCVDVKSITTAGQQKLWLCGKEMDKLRGKKVLFCDDVISTGNTVASVVKLLELADAKLAGELCVFAEGEAKDRENIFYLKELPLFATTDTNSILKM